MDKTLKSLIVTVAISSIFPLSTINAQTEGGRHTGTMPDRFKEYREKVLGDYKNHRNRILENYDKFLEGVWTELTTFKGEEYNPKPKPATPPHTPVTKPSAPAQLPQPTAPVTVDPTPSVVDDTDHGKPDVSPTPTTPTPTTKPTPTTVEATPFDFYGIEIKLPPLEVQLMHSMRNKNDYAQQWRNLANAGFVDNFTASVRELAREYNLNDYLSFELLMKYASSRYPDVDASSRASLVHFLLNNMGYGVRLGTTDTGVTLLLLPLKQKIYARSFMEIDGQRYYIFTDDSHTPAQVGGYVSTCHLPSGTDTGSALDLLIPNGLNLPHKPYRFEISYGGLTLKGELNANIMPMLYHYPQMPMGDYASSNLLPELRESLKKQVREQLDSMPKLTAVNTLLSFIQNGFEYATDEQQHGFEKPYFLEETLFYPKCDCEDRSIIYGYLLSNALDVENHLIFYPGHESVALTIDSELDTPLNGDNYTYKGRRFLISDPTFLGASTGMCMPQFKTTTPKIDYEYKVK